MTVLMSDIHNHDLVSDGSVCMLYCAKNCITSSCFEAGLSMAPAKACRIWHLVSIKEVWRSCNSVCI